MKTKGKLSIGNGSFLLVLALSAVLTVTNKTYAQDRWGLTLRGGADFATAKLGDADLKTGFGFEGSVSYRFLSHLHAQAGWSWNKFKTNQSFAGSDVDFEETGYLAGLQFIHPIADSKFSYLVGAGATYNHIETENPEGDIIADSGHGFGWQAEAGISIEVFKHWKLIPSVRYRALSRELKIDETITPVDLKYIATQLGITWSF